MSTSTANFEDKIVSFKTDKLEPELKECLKINQKCSKSPSIVRQTRLRTSRRLFNFFYLFGNNRITYRAFRQYFNNRDNTVLTDRYFVFRTNSAGFRNLETSTDQLSSTAYIDDDKDINVAIDLKYYQQAAKREDLKKFLTKYRDLLPEDLIPFSVEHVKFYMGAFSADVNIVFDKNIIKRFFSNKFSQEKLCINFARYRKVPQVENVCKNTQLNPDFHRKFKGLRRRYNRAKRNYDKLIASPIQQTKDRYLKRISKFFYDRNFKNDIAKFMISFAKDKEYKRDVRLFSTLSAFPGDIDEIKESNTLQGNNDRFEIEQMEIIGDTLFGIVEPFFYQSGSTTIPLID